MSNQQEIMSDLMFDFDDRKATEAILYLAARIPHPTLHGITHLLYFADKTSLERFGRFICGDDYYAMEHGPVPTFTYNLLKGGHKTEELGFTIAGYKVRPLRDAEEEWLSESDIECLDQTLAIYQDKPFWFIKKESHDEAYERAWSNREGKGSSRMSLESIVELLEDSDELLEHLSNPDPG